MKKMVEWQELGTSYVIDDFPNWENIYLVMKTEYGCEEKKLAGRVLAIDVQQNDSIAIKNFETVIKELGEDGKKIILCKAARIDLLNGYIEQVKPRLWYRGEWDEQWESNNLQQV